VGGWILPSLAYAVFLGLLGVTTKLALRTVGWQDVLLWLPIVYAVAAVAVVLTSGARLPLGVGGAWAAASAVLAAAAYVVFAIALERADASIVVPVTSAYPIVTVVASALFLAERVTVARVIGTLLVVAGVIVLTR
jgi:transporter family protein